MTRKTLHLCSLLCSILVASLISDVKAKTYYKSSSHSSHSYPSSHGGLSGSHGSHGSVLHSSHSSHSSHSYPSSQGGSGSRTVQSHTYPSSPHGNSGGGTITQQKYPSAHVYPTSNTLSGGSSGSSIHSYPNSNSLSGGSRGGYPGYPNSVSGSGSKVGSASYPSSPGLSGGTHYQTHTTGGSSYPHHTNTQQGHYYTNTNTVVHHHHYSYSPPSVIHYHTSSGLVSYPVYRGALPGYVYDYSSSGNKYSSLLAGLALYNLGRMSSNTGMHSYHTQYVPQPGEHCKFGVRYRYGAVEEVPVDCRSITYFIYQDPGSLSPAMNAPMQGTNVIVNTNSQQVLSSNGVLMQSSQPINSVTITTTQANSISDPRFQGAPVTVRPDMECYVSRITSFSNIVKPVPCDLLQTYSSQSMYRRNSALKLKSSLFVLMISFALFML